LPKSKRIVVISGFNAFFNEKPPLGKCQRYFHNNTKIIPKRKLKLKN